MRAWIYEAWRYFGWVLYVSGMSLRCVDYFMGRSHSEIPFQMSTTGLLIIIMVSVFQMADLMRKQVQP